MGDGPLRESAATQHGIAAPHGTAISRVGIVAALPGEARCLTGRRVRADSLIPLSEYAILKLSGIGPERARRGAQALVEAGTQALVSWGCAAGLDPELAPGSLVLPRAVLNATGQFDVDTGWHRRLRECLQGKIPIVAGALAHTTQVLASPTEKATLFEQTGAVAADMESRAVAAVAAEHKMPVAVIRAVSDPANMVLPAAALAGVDEHGRLRPLRLFGALIQAPAQWSDLADIHHGYKAACTTLRRVASEVGSNLLCDPM